MPLSRRQFLALPAMLAAPAGPVLEPAEPDGVALSWLGQAGAVLLPGGARLLGVLALRRGRLAAVEVAVPAPEGGALRLLALCGPERGAPHLLGLEVLAWRGAGGAHLDTRFAAVSDGVRIRLARQAAAPRDATHWRRAEWADYLAWTDAGLEDAPVRAPVAGTWQAGLAGLRARVGRWLATPRAALAAGDLAALGVGAAAVSLPVG